MFKMFNPQWKLNVKVKSVQILWFWLLWRCIKSLPVWSLLQIWRFKHILRSPQPDAKGKHTHRTRVCTGLSAALLVLSVHNMAAIILLAAEAWGRRRVGGDGEEIRKPSLEKKEGRHKLQQGVAKVCTTWTALSSMEASDLVIIYYFRTSSIASWTEMDGKIFKECCQELQCVAWHCTRGKTMSMSVLQSSDTESVTIIFFPKNKSQMKAWGVYLSCMKGVYKGQGMD